MSTLRASVLISLAASAFAPGLASARPAQDYAVHVPPAYVEGTPMPLVILLHGYGASGAIQEAYMQFQPLADEYGFLYLHPDGAVDAGGNRYWNATDACCDFGNTGIDHSGMLRALIDSTKANFSVDDRRVWIIGHSNGGFMAYRMACDHADSVAAIVSLAGATFDDPNQCAPVEPVHVLQIHGTNDGTILYGGGNIGGNTYPGAIESVETWAAYDGCDIVPDNSAPNIDLDAGIPGNDSSVTRYLSQCSPGGSGELWTIHGGAHVPDLSDSFSRQVVEYLYAHPKPGAGSNYCQSSANSSGAAAVMDAFGSASLAANDLALFASGLPANQFGIFYYGPEEQSLVFGNGTRCVGPGNVGVFRLALQNSGADGVLYQPLDYSDPPQTDGQITAGSTWKFQAWFRDPQAGGASFDLSDGYSITFYP